MKVVAIWIILRIVPALIMWQTLFYKFTGAPESIYIFSTIGLEPWGRYGIGIGELIAGVLLLIPALSWLGALIGAGIMAGALFFHLVILGIEVQGDDGLLFILALIVFTTCMANLYVDRNRIISVVQLFKNKK